MPPASPDVPNRVSTQAVDTSVPRGGRRALVAAAFLVVVGIAATLRLTWIGSQPSGLFQDEAAEGLDAFRLLHVPGFHPLFFDDDGGREVPFAYMVAVVFRIAGASATSLRVTAALVGIAGVAVLPFALRRFGMTAAFAGTAWAAGSLWLVCVDRDGMRNCLVPLAGAAALAALLMWESRPGRGRAVVAGIACGLGLWTYQPLKLIPLWVVVWLLWIRARNPDRWRALRPNLWTLVAGYSALAAPIMWVAITDPAGYFGRGLAVSAANPDQHLSSLPDHWLRTLLMFGITGDPNPRHDAATVALIPPAVALLALLGIVRCWRNRRNPAHALVLIGLPVFLLPGMVALEGDAPHFLRALGLAPIVAAIVGLGATEAVELASRLRPRVGPAVGMVAVTGALVAMTAQTATDYLGRPAVDLYYPYANDLVAVADAARSQGSVVLLDDYRALTVRFIDRDTPPRIVTTIEPGALDPVPAGTPIIARDPRDLDTVLGYGSSARAAVAARDPQGNPVVWLLLR